jgi:hypothetical protein
LAFLALVFCSFSLFGSNTVSAISPFIRYTGEITVDGARGITDSWVIWDDNVYKMWFTCPKTEVSPSQVSDLIAGVNLGAALDALEAQDIDGLLEIVSNLEANELYDMAASSATVIGYATSSDGINWHVENSEVLSAATPLQSVATPCVIKDSAGYKMWYTRNTTDYTPAQLEDILDKLTSDNDTVVTNAIIDLIEANLTVIDYATSTDGIIWTKKAQGVLTGEETYLGNNVAAPCVIWDEAENVYKMWFSNVSTGIEEADIEHLVEHMDTVDTGYLWELQEKITGSIGYATSLDGEDWAGINRNVFSKDTGVLNAVATPSVIYNGDNYEMWYTYGVTSLNSDDIDTIIDELSEIDFDALTALMESEDYDGLLEALTTIIDDEITETKARLNGTTTKIGFASSEDGISGWTENNTYGLEGVADTPWASVGRPCAIESEGIYQMWFTKGIDELTSQNLVDLWQGNISTIGYATNGTVLELYQGWNFIGLTVDPVGPAIEQILGNIIADVGTVWTFDAPGSWYFFTTIEGAPQGGLTEMALGIGYWVEIKNPVSLLMLGGEPTYPFEIQLFEGWNMISIPKTPSSPEIEEVLVGILDNVQTVWTYDASAQLWDYFTTVEGAHQGGLTQMIEGRAYWVEMKAGDTLVIN